MAEGPRPRPRANSNNWDMMHLRKIWVREDEGLTQDLFKDPMIFLFYRRMFLRQTLLFVFKQTSPSNWSICNGDP